MAVSVGTIEALLRLKDELSPALKVAGQNMTEAGKKMSSAGRALLPLSAALGAIGIGAIKAASDFESSFAGVRKTVDATEEEFAALAQGFRDMAQEIPISVNELNAVGEAAGQLGIKTEDILDFTRVMADLGATTNLSADEAATSIARLANITGLSSDEYDELGATIVDLGNNFATTEAEIVEFGLRIAGAGELAGLSETNILAIGTAMTSIGVQAEAGGTSVQKVLNAMTQAVALGGAELRTFAETAGVTVESFRAGFDADAAGAFTSFVEGLNRQGTEAFVTLENLGLQNERVIRSFLGLANAGDLLSRTLDTSEAAWKENTALALEAQKRYETFESQVKLLWNSVKDVAIEIGTAFLPVLRDMVESMREAVPHVKAAAEWFANLPEPVKAVALAVGAITVASAPFLIAMGLMTTAIGTMATAIGSTSVGLLGGLGALGIALAAGWATYAFTTWLRESSPAVEAFTDVLGDALLDVTGFGLALDIVNERLEEGTTWENNLTQAQLEANKAWVESTDVRRAAAEVQAQIIEGNKNEQTAAIDLLAKMNGLVKETIDLGAAREVEAKAQKAAADLTDAGIIAMVRAAEAQEAMAAASELTGQKITDAAQAYHILEVAAENTREAIERAAEEAKAAEIAKRAQEEAAAINEVVDSLVDLAGAMEDLNGHIRMLERDVTQVDVMKPLVDQAKKRLAELAKEMPGRFTIPFKDGLKTAMEDLPNVIVGALQGGGDLFASIGASIGGTIASSMSEQLTVLLSDKLGKGLGDMLGGMIPGLGGILGGLAGGLLDKGISALGGLFGGGELEEVNDMRDAFFETFGGFEEFSEKMAEVSEEDWAAKLFNAETVEEFNALVAESSGLLDEAQQSMQLQNEAQEALNEAVERYGFTIEELGPAMQRQELHEQAAQLYQDFQLLSASGIDVNTIIERMGPSLIDFVNTAKATGQAVPEAMRPVIDQLIASGQLVDANGEAFENAEDAGITFAQTMDEMFTSLIEKIDAMVNALLGIDDIEVTPTVNLPNVPTGGRHDRNPVDIEAQEGFISPSMPVGPRAGGGTDIRVHPDEAVSVTPAGQQGSDEQVLALTVNVGNEQLYKSIEKATKTGELRVFPDAVKAF